jgi:alanine racemase
MKLAKLKAESFVGIYTHFAMAKNRQDMEFTTKQFVAFEAACALFEKAGFSGLMRHASATGGVLLGAAFHADMARVGIGLYGIWPSDELERQLSGTIALHPALSLHSIVSETKRVAKGEGIGYDLTERVKKDAMIAIVPIGYWHGIPRAASSLGTVTILKKKARIIGRVSMDMITILVTDIPCRAGSEVAVIPSELAREMGASPYEVVTRLNPLIHKTIT